VLWFSVWFLLVAGTLVGAFFLGRRLWRSAKDLLNELENASMVLDRLERLREEAQRRFPAPTPPTADVDATLAERAQFRAVRQAHLEHVAARRARRMRVAMAHWRRVGTAL
jgi:hypothetical protein